jgi:hypothetical protein
MVTLRPTRKLQSLLPLSEDAVGASDTALGDWYVNRLVVDRRPLLLLTSAASLLPILIPARDLRSIPHRLSEIVATRLHRLGVSAPLIDAECRAMRPVLVGPTTDRSVVGIMVDFAKGVPYYLDAGWDDRSLAFAENRLAETPCHAGKPSEQVVFPDAKPSRLLVTKWAG